MYATFCLPHPDVNGEDGEGRIKDRGEGGCKQLSVYLTQMSMVKMVKVELKTEVREEEASNFLFTWPRCQW